MCTVVFFAEAGLSVVTYLAANSKLANINCNENQDMTAEYGYDGSSDPFHRSLNGMGSNFYDGPVPYSVIDNTVLCNDHRHLGGNNNDLGNIDASLIAQVVPTTLVAMMIGNAVTALLFYGLGKMKNTASVIGFIPASVVAGFLTCIGYKVITVSLLWQPYILLMIHLMFFKQLQQLYLQVQQLFIQHQLDIRVLFF